jgi:hypothetical protein
MLGVTCFGLVFTPAFYTIVRNLGRKEQKERLSEVTVSRDNRKPMATSRGSA